jgi:hypothetical protein
MVLKIRFLEPKVFVLMLYIIAEDPDAYYITEMARDVSKAGRSPYFIFNGGRSVLKRR